MVMVLLVLVLVLVVLCRFDADGRCVPPCLRLTHVEARLRQLEGRALASDAGKPRGKAQPAPYAAVQQAAAGNGLAPSAARVYNADADAVPPAKVSVCV